MVLNTSFARSQVLEKDVQDTTDKDNSKIITKEEMLKIKQEEIDESVCDYDIDDLNSDAWECFSLTNDEERTNDDEEVIYRILVLVPKFLICNLVRKAEK
ncbi:hypothetical protein BpHYR1_047452 [Brachionus plicatilis]|uniref:EF-hand domain-containing protein n=1 Tax=Brachionus plicatilis TaxID=10195 RepID=A0A3M7PTF7_BRAPC|nr:hypothetical protein BpHYR1_047452 [Brachionus plicatilis]